MADERTTSVPTGDQAIPSAEVSPTAAHQPAAGADARRQKSWVWFAAILAFVVAFGVPYLLLTSGKRSDEPERAVATAEPNDFEQRMMQAAGFPTAPPPLIVPQGPIPSSPIPADELFRRVSPAVVQVHSHDRQGRHTSSGSGFLVNKNGLIVTNYHVIKNAHSVKVVLANDKHLAVAGAAAFDEEADIAILSVPFQFSAEPLDLAEEGLPVGAKVYAIGNPLGLSNTLSDGLVSGHREKDRFRVIQTTAPISPGSSGGPLLGVDGSVVGVTTFLVKGGQNLNFAVPASQVANLLHRSEVEGKLSRFPLSGRTDPGLGAKDTPSTVDDGTIEITVDNPAKLNSTKVKKYTVHGLSLGMTHDQAWEMIGKTSSLIGVKDVSNPSRIYVYHRMPDGGRGQAVLYLIWETGERSMTQIAVYQPFRSSLSQNFRRLLTFEAVDNESSFRREFLGYASRSKIKLDLPEIGLRLTSFEYDDLGLQIMHNRNSRGDEVYFVIVPLKP